MTRPLHTRELFERLYRELRAEARRCLQGERAGHTLRPTALVHEVFLRLDRGNGREWGSEEHFLAVAARAMRRILVDWARGRDALKRGGGWLRVTLDDDVTTTERDALDLIALDEALGRVERLDPVGGSLIEMRFFAGMTEAEAARALGISERTARREWAWARSLLRHELEGGGNGGGASAARDAR